MSADNNLRLWLIALGLSLGPAVGNGLARFSYGLVLPAMRSDLGWTYTEAGWINTANAAGYLIGALLAFYIISRNGPRGLFVGGMAGTAIALLLSASTRDFWLLSVWRVIAGIGGAAVFIAGSSMASALFRNDASRNALAIAIYFGGAGLGLVLSGIALPLMLDEMGAAGWPQAWLVMGIASGVAFVPSLWAVRAMDSSATAVSELRSEPLPLRAMLPAFTGYFLFAAGYIVYVTFLVAWMREQGANSALVALTWAVLGVAVMLSPFLWRSILAASRGGMAMALSCTGTAMGTLFPLVFDGSGAVLLSAALFGLSFFIVPSAASSFGRKNLKQTQWGPSFALFTIVFAIGQMIGPVAVGAIADWTHNITYGIAGAGVILIIGALFAAGQRPLNDGT